MFRKIYLVLIISLITIFSFSIVNVYCPFKTFGIFDVWLMQLNGFKEYYFFSYGFLKNLLLLFVIYLTIFYKSKINNKIIFVSTMVLLTLLGGVLFKTNIRLNLDFRETPPTEELVEKKISIFMLSKEVECNY